MAATKISPLHALTVAALALPGLWTADCQAEEDEINFQYSRYQESRRNLIKTPNHSTPIEVDSLFGSAKVTLADRVKFAFNYSQDTWSGATPITVAPLVVEANQAVIKNVKGGKTVVVGASPIIASRQITLNKNLKPLAFNKNGKFLGKDLRVVNVLSTASPETRKQGDFKLGYEWDEAALYAGGGISVENDYESRFGNINGRWDLNQKLTTLNLGLSYTNSDTSAIIDHDASTYLTKTAFLNQIENQGAYQVLTGNRQDWGSNFGISQVLNKEAFLEANVAYTRSTGYMENPYKATTVVFVDPEQPGINRLIGDVKALLEQRPDERDQWALTGSYHQYIGLFDAALHFNYRYFQDTWGISAHTFEAEWVQPIATTWTLTPRIRYYSQDAADFYTPYLTSKQAFVSIAKDSSGREILVDAKNPNNGIQYFRDDNYNLIDSNGNLVNESTVSTIPKTVAFDPKKLPANFSSDQRLSAFGAISGGVNLKKQITKGVSVEAGFEYYTHAGALKLGGGGEGSYADFGYYVANAALNVNLASLNAGTKPGDHAGHSAHHHYHQGGAAPAGVMFAHMMNKADDVMVGYRFMHSHTGGKMLNGDAIASDASILANGCVTRKAGCKMVPTYMDMSMHMLDIMYAPTDWLNLMLMPQFMDMQMNLRQLDGTPAPKLGEHIHAGTGHATGGIGDTGMYAMIKLFDLSSLHHLHLTLGLSAPTGDVDITLRRTHKADEGFIHYGMQLGSGTWDFKPSLTYSGQLGDWSWGAQISGTKRLEDKNASGYLLGDIFESTAWGSYRLNHWLSASVRGLYSDQSAISGEFNPTPGLVNGRLRKNVNPNTSSVDYASNYGGRYWDMGFGLNAQINNGDLAGNSFGVEWLQPIATDVNGYQLDRGGAISATWAVAF